MTSHDIEPRGSPDDQFINVDDCDELRHWSRMLQTTPDELKAAVRAAGTSARNAREYLKLHDRGTYEDSRKTRKHDRRATLWM